MMTGSFDPVSRGETWIWSHDLIDDTDGSLMNLGGCTFTLRIGSDQPRLPDYGWPVPWGFFGLDCVGGAPVATLDNVALGGVMIAQQGTIVATIAGLTTMSWPRGQNRLTLDVSRYGETVRLVEMSLPVLGF